MQISQGGYDQDHLFTRNSKPLPGINIFLHSLSITIIASLKSLSHTNVCVLSQLVMLMTFVQQASLHCIP